MPGSCYVYVLYREDGRPFYVGKGSGERWLEHERWVKRGRSHKDNIIANMKDRGVVVPKEKVSEGLSHDEASKEEKRLISEIGRTHDGGPLTNLTAGGDGLCDPTPDVRAKISKTLSGRKNGPPSVETRKKISEAQRGRPGRPATVEANAKRSASLAESWKKFTPEQRAKRGMAGKKHSIETKAKMRNAALGRVISDEQRAAVSKRQKGRKQSPEEIARRSISLRAAWARRKALR